MLGKRSQDSDEEEEAGLDEVVAEQILKRRKTNVAIGAPITLNELRSAARANIMDVVRANKDLLCSWNDILDLIVMGKDSQQFFKLKKVADFVDGFQMSIPLNMTAS